MTIRISDDNHVRTITLIGLKRSTPSTNGASVDALTVGLADAATDGDVAVVLLTGAGRAFSAGMDLKEMQARITARNFTPGRHGFPALIDSLSTYPKPVVCAVNGIGVGLGATILGFADLVFMSSTARLKYPFTSLGVETGSRVVLPIAPDCWDDSRQRGS